MTAKIASFSPIASADAQILILGTMPSVASLQKQQYYGHPRNAFWPIMQALLADGELSDYQQRRQLLIAHKIALWDVLQSCSRTGSLDSNIDINTILVNDFSDFFTNHPDIKQVCFNGAMAEKLFIKHALPTIKQNLPTLKYLKLPSTSPANAALTWQQKIEAWKVITGNMVK